jgi:hypothetical protein
MKKRWQEKEVPWLKAIGIILMIKAIIEWVL